MDWILLLVWITLISSYNCRHHHPRHGYPHYGYGGVSRFDCENYGPPLRRSDHESYATEENERISQRQRYDHENYGPKWVETKGSIAVDNEIDQEMQVPRTENGSSKIDSHPIITNRRGQRNEQPYVPEVPESCKKMQICDKVPNYPTELAASIIAGLSEGEIRNKFNVDQIEPEIQQRQGTENMQLCSFNADLLIPLAVPSKDGEWYFVLNDVNNPLQVYRVEICNNTGGACNKIAVFNKKFHATCRQKYVQRFMTVIDKAGEVKYNMPFRVPSCCSCVATYIGK